MTADRDVERLAWAKAQVAKAPPLTQEQIAKVQRIVRAGQPVSPARRAS